MKLRPPGTGFRALSPEAFGVLSEARADAARLRHEAYEEGRAASGVALVLEQLRAHDALAAQTDAIIDLALQLASTVLGHEAATDRTLVSRAAAIALDQHWMAKRALLRVHPDDAATVRDRLETLVSPSAEHQLLVVEGDASLTRGGAVLETELGRVEVTLETQLAALERAMRGKR